MNFFLTLVLHYSYVNGWICYCFILFSTYQQLFCIVIFPFQNAPRPAWLRASANTADTANSEQTPSESMTSEDDEELQVVS